MDQREDWQQNPGARDVHGQRGFDGDAAGKAAPVRRMNSGSLRRVVHPHEICP